MNLTYFTKKRTYEIRPCRAKTKNTSYLTSLSYFPYPIPYVCVGNMYKNVICITNHYLVNIILYCITLTKNIIMMMNISTYSTLPQMNKIIKHEKNIYYKLFWYWNIYNVFVLFVYFMCRCHEKDLPLKFNTIVNVKFIWLLFFT